MRSSLPPEGLLSRRTLLGAALGSGLASAHAQTVQEEGNPQALLRKGGVVVAFRHALAPGTFDPPGFRLGDCSTQRNLSEQGRDQARRMGEWFRARQLEPTRVRSSPWCRCIDSATLTFGAPQVWPALGSPRGVSESTGAQHLQELQEALVAVAGQTGRFEAWFTHMFVLSDLTGYSAQSGEGLILAPGPSGKALVLGRIAPPA